MSWSEYHIHISDWQPGARVAELHDEDCEKVAVIANDLQYRDAVISLGDLVTAASRDMHKRRGR